MPEFTNDPNEITSVYASFPNDSVFDPDYWDETSVFYDPIKMMDIQDDAFNFLEAQVKATFPKACMLLECTGWEGAHAQFTPRAETADGRIYEGFDEWLLEVHTKMSELGGFDTDA